MTITGSGALSLNNLNVEFGRAGTTQLSISESFAGTYAQYGDINRNAAPGRTVFTTFTGSSNFNLANFYSYDDTETNYWYYYFDNQNYNDDSIPYVYLATNLIYNTSIPANSVDDSTAYVDTTVSATTGDDLELRLLFPATPPAYVDISVTDPDTGATIFSSLAADPVDYDKPQILATVYGYQRFYFSLVFYN
jgi:hypothetical protein